nr:hypothetical protein [Tanacetum cinerariifolium]
MQTGHEDLSWFGHEAPLCPTSLPEVARRMNVFSVLYNVQMTCIKRAQDLRFREFTLSSLDVLQGFSFFLQIGLTLILATLDGLDVGLLGDVIGEDDCDDDDG